MGKQSRGGEPANKASRYTLVKRYLDAANEGSCSDYQGNGRFWNLPLCEFLEVVIYGVRMIAPPAEDYSQLTPQEVADQGPISTNSPAADAAPGPSGSCCDAASDTGRSARSGLINGLKGKSPFDGSQFPQLMWGGGSTLPYDQIAFIEQWIDAGCPETDEPTISIDEGAAMRRAMGDEAHPPYAGPTNEHLNALNGTRVRKNINCMSADEFRNFQVAIAEMRRYDNFPADRRSWTFWSQIHPNNCQHGWEEFLPWHRAYLYEMELQMSEWDPGVALPYWSWAEYYPQNKTLQGGPNGAVDNGFIPLRYGCWVTKQALAELNGKINKTYHKDLTSIEWHADKPDENVYMSGPRLLDAAGIKYPPAATPEYADVLEIYKQLVITNPAWHQARWPGGGAEFFRNYPSPGDIARILKIDNFFDFGSGPQDNHFFGACENIHNLMHNFSGGSNPNYETHKRELQFGDMTSGAVTAYDPIFWGHHSNVDRLWWKWQQLHPGMFADNPNAVLPPWHYTVQDMRSISPLGYTYSLDSIHFPTDPTIAMTRFKSETVSPSKTALGLHSKAVIQLHQVQYLQSPGLVRAYLNHPGADVDTKANDSEYFAGEFHIFQGQCVGGPGHCDPATARSAGDLRARDRKTPGNISIDATDTVQRLLEKGETKFDIHLVVLDMAGKPAKDVLKLSSVSLELSE